MDSNRLNRIFAQLDQQPPRTLEQSNAYTLNFAFRRIILGNSVEDTANHFNIEIGQIKALKKAVEMAERLRQKTELDHIKAARVRNEAMLKVTDWLRLCEELNLKPSALARIVRKKFPEYLK